ncbi:zinc finger protein [Rutstroemia sp. NJR-2017a BBW]|nr:zinc finger protein [Rutstroemia sp. NJR-2017a BBW]
MDTRQRDTASRPTRVQKTPRTYTCSICSRIFKRSEHCSRHERGHTHEKPFPCRLCGRRYARKDVVIRHEKSFHRLENPRRQQAPAQSSSPDVDSHVDSFGDTIVVSTNTQKPNIQIPSKQDQAQDSPEMQSTLDPLLRQHDEQLAGAHPSSLDAHLHGDSGGYHSFSYQGFIDPALDTSDLFLHPSHLTAQT